MEEVGITTDTIKLDQFLKWANITDTGGEAKLLIQGGNIRVNGEVEYRRGCKLVPGDRIEIKNKDEVYRVTEV
ncbi:MAG: RNA-binding S4 domain-containing protein [Halanaerobiales bacterium]